MDEPVLDEVADEVADEVIGDEELAALALAADPDAALDAVLDDDVAVPMRSLDGSFPELLPAWYMPVPAAGVGRSGGRRAVVAVVIVSLLALNAVGLCVTSGIVEIAW